MTRSSPYSVRHVFRSRDIHVRFGEGVWMLRRESGITVTSPRVSKWLAVRIGKAVARREGIELIVHDRLGDVERRFDYWRDT